MLISRLIILLNLAAIVCFWAVWEYRVSVAKNNEGGQGPDVIVGVIPSVHRWGNTASETAFSIGTTSCNIGTARLTWISNSPLHPVISQNMYRVKDGRIEMIGMSWLKHGFSVVAGNACGTCTDPGSNFLGVGCSDPYGATLNGSQSLLGPRSEVNATTGVLASPRGSLPQTGLLPGRLRVLTTDINPNLNPGARYFVESQYIHPEDAAAGNGNNNASYREVFVSPVQGGQWTVQTSGSSPTVRMQPAINAWQAVYPDVKLFAVDVPNDGRIIVGLRTTPIMGGSGFHTEVAVENLNSHRSVRLLRLEHGPGVVSNPGFNDIDYQFEPYSGEDWNPTVLDNFIEWSTDTYDVDPNANAIRWNTLYSFWCDSELPPRKLTLGLFRPGEVSEMEIDLIDVVQPETYELSGEVVGGDFNDILESNGQYFQINPSQRLARPTVDLQLDTTSSTNSPTDFAFRLEAFISDARIENVEQTILFLNHQTGRYELIDSRLVEHSTQSLELTPTGNFSRFVHDKTGWVSAKIQWYDPARVPRHPSIWTINIDNASWLISD